MRVAILGMGAIGHVVARALEGRKAVELVRIDRTRSPLRSGEGPVEAAIVCTKTYGTAWAADIAARVLSPKGVAVTVQNGLGNYEVLADKVGADRVSLGAIYVGARLLLDGSLFSTGPGRVELARPRDPDARGLLERLAQHLGDGGMQVSVVDDATVWRKLAVNAAMNPTTAVFGLTNGELLTHPAAGPLSDELARETARVATAAGVTLNEDEAVDAWRDIATRLGANRSSMLQDLDAGKPTEIDAISGAVAREGRRAGIDAPVNEAIALLVEAISRPKH
ncbi:MAG: ketopantoate reductase family protein [Candidatus Limnocylindria bacterium]